MWRVLQETYCTIKIRVLHPLISESEFTTILQGLPEGSKLSPPLFGIFISELLEVLKDKYPGAVTYSTSGMEWAGAIAYVDDIVLISQCPYQLQAMLNTCQDWCNQARIQINTDKTKVVHQAFRVYFVLETAIRITVTNTAIMAVVPPQLL